MFVFLLCSCNRPLDFAVQVTVDPGKAGTQHGVMILTFVIESIQLPLSEALNISTAIQNGYSVLLRKTFGKTENEISGCNLKMSNVLTFAELLA